MAFNQQDKPDEFPRRKGLWGSRRRPHAILGAEDGGVKRAEVITARLVQDERGWLWLAS